MRAAPKGTLVAIGNHRNEVIVGDIETGEVAVIDKSEHGRTEDLAWSPDGAVARVHVGGPMRATARSSSIA